MNNFEKFKNKEITGTESSKVFGGGPLYEFCSTPGIDACISSFYHYNSQIWCGYTWQDPQCHNYWCQLAIDECTMG